MVRAKLDKIGNLQDIRLAAKGVEAEQRFQLT
jgi:hypothetical protein